MHELEVTNNSGQVKVFVGSNPTPQTATTHGNTCSEINFSLATSNLGAENYGTYIVYAYATGSIRLDDEYVDADTDEAFDENGDYVGAYAENALIKIGNLIVLADGSIDTSNSTGLTGILYYSIAADEANPESAGSRGTIAVFISATDNLSTLPNS